MANVFLYGALRREFGASFDLYVESPVEALRALEANFPGRFLKHIREGHYRVIRGDRRTGLDLDLEMLEIGLGTKALHIVPVVGGAGRKGGAKVILGVALMAVAIGASGAMTPLLAGDLTGVGAALGKGFISWSTVAQFGLTMSLTGVAQLMSPQPKAPASLEPADRRPSFLFEGAVNTQEQGGTVPLIYGRVKTGSVVVSAGIETEQDESVQEKPPSVTAASAVPLNGVTTDGLQITSATPNSGFQFDGISGGTLYWPNGVISVTNGEQVVNVETARGMKFRLTDPNGGRFSVRTVGTNGRLVGKAAEVVIRHNGQSLPPPEPDDDGTVPETGGGEGNDGSAHGDGSGASDNGGGGVGGSGGGGKKGGGGGRAAQEDPNTLRSKATARVIDVLGEGPIQGLVNKEQSIFFDSTPIKGPDNADNFHGVSWVECKGLPDQKPVTGFPAAESEVKVDAKILFEKPLVRAIDDATATAVRVTISIPSLNRTDPSNGDMHGSKVEIKIEVRGRSKTGWETKISDTIEGKTTSTYERAYRVSLPPDTDGWEIRVSRITADSTQVAEQNETHWKSYTIITDGLFSYPDTALIGITVDAEQFGNQIPQRAYDVKGLIIQVPSNYNPETRVYQGIWDGSFKLAWTDNPAWILYDILTNPRYGLGGSIAPGQTDKWSLYEIAQYCDGLVPSGRRKDDGTEELEPRFTFNGVIGAREEAYTVVQAIASTFRGLVYWSSGQIFARADMPADAVKLVTPANVIGGDFSYSGTALKARHSVALVQWNDPDDGYKPAVEVVENPDLIQKYGWRETGQIRAFGCTRRSQARRLGLWMLDSEQHQTETVTYSASYDHADISPGDIIHVADPSYAMARNGGRLVEIDAAGRLLTLDEAVDLLVSETYQISVTLPDGRIESRRVTTAGTGGKVSQLDIETAFSTPPIPGAMWALTGSDLAPRPFRVMAIKETQPNIYEVTALFHDVTKYERVERNVTLAPPPYQRPREDMPAPTNVTASENRYMRNGQPRSRLTVSWSAPSHPYLNGYLLTIGMPTGTQRSVTLQTVTTYDIDDAELGDYTLTLRSTAWNGMRSRPVTITITAQGWETIPDLFISHLQVDQRGTDTNFVTRDPVFTWRPNFPDTSWEPTNEPGAGAGRTEPRFRDYAVRIFDPVTQRLLRTEHSPRPEFRYTLEANRQDSAQLGRAHARRRIIIEVTIRDTLWRESRPTRLEVYNPPLPLPAGLTVSGAVGAIHVFFRLPTDPDFAGTLVWQSETSDFPLDKDHQAANGPQDGFVIPANPNIGYYIRVGHYDAFGPDEMVVAAPIYVAAAFQADFEPPDRPEKPALTSWVGEDGRVRIKAEWNVSTARDFAEFQAGIRQTEDDPLSWQWVYTREPSYTWDGVVAGVSYDVWVRANDSSANYSPESEIATIVAARDDKPPGPITATRLDASFRGFWLSWTNPSDPDYNHAEVWESVDQDRDNATRIGTVPGAAGQRSVLDRSGLEPGVTRTYWLRPVDTSKNAGDWTERVAGTTASLQIPDFPDDFGPIPFGTALPAGAPEGPVQLFYKLPEMRLHRWNGSEWEPAIQLDELPGEITETQIGQNAIKARHITANEIRSNHILAGEIRAGHLAADSVTTGAIQAGAITADHLSANRVVTRSAQIENGIIDTAHIRELDASKIKAGSILSGSVQVSTSAGVTTIDGIANSGDPAARINQLSTTIEPGKIKIAGGVTLGDWRAGPNSTEINGGVIRANTISANKLMIGARGVTVQGLEFTANKTNNTISWTAGSILHMGDDGGHARVNVPAGGTPVGWSYAYVFWVKGQGVLQATQDTQEAYGNDRIHLATYHGGSMVIANYGGTIIDGERIVTGSITANQIGARTILARHIEAEQITGTHIAANTISAQQLIAGSVDRDRLALRVIGEAQIDDLAVTNAKIGFAAIDRANIRDLTVNGQKIEDFATSNMSAAQGTYSASVALWTVGKPVLLSAVRGAFLQVITGFGGNENNSITYEWRPTSIGYMWIETPGPGVHSWSTNNPHEYWGYSRDHFCAISAVELRK
ncbi:hypothetical protein HL658_32065 [Azospirillum sp. RWY-5-1]|uniref:Fibronectin type-III domain-containing protein n=1 Tax=Azospirillum oleiclasticum TaxID=2735135 RepID=A0ABX2TFT1_9PROT|nr:phage tail protein [Azospirillum oleiclasticum]NYZ17205.1 hypothetical protein [Azospirillum oleiclasticum]NYZ23086.1 hypothetical protein [Azospirillum oleiclasticum]